MTTLGSSYTIRVPSQNLAGGAHDMKSRLQTWEWRRLPKWAESVTLDFSENQFIEPWFLVLLTSHALRLREEVGVPITAILKPSNPANVYVEQMGIMEVLETGSSTLQWDHSHKNTGLHVLRTHQDVLRFVQSAAKLGLSDTNETLDALKYGMAELGRNVVQHSSSPIGGIAIAQLFPERKSLQISIADAGLGVMKSLKNTYSEVSTNLEALKLAVLPHVSGAFKGGTYSASDNAGLGLFFSKEICWRSGGSFWLLSKDALLGVIDRDDTGKGKVYKKINAWDGTCVTMDLPATGTNDFSSLLSLCRDLAAKARESSGEAGLDFLDCLPDIDGVQVLKVGDLQEDVQMAATLREQIIVPAVTEGRLIVLDFEGARFITQSFAHALLNDAFHVPGSLTRLSFVHCSRSTEEAIATVAAYAASYKQCV